MRTYRKIELTDEQIDKFWKRVDVKSKDECWEWQGPKNGWGYGLHLSFIASRIAWVLVYGDIPYGMFVCHKCDNPLCCNPNHLFLGTHDDNMKDATIKGRRNWKPDRFNWKYCWRSRV
jgi:hypothetical protein